MVAPPVQMCMFLFTNPNERIQSSCSCIPTGPSDSRGKAKGCPMHNRQFRSKVKPI